MWRFLYSIFNRMTIFIWTAKTLSAIEAPQTLKLHEHMRRKNWDYSMWAYILVWVSLMKRSSTSICLSLILLLLCAHFYCSVPGRVSYWLMHQENCILWWGPPDWPCNSQRCVSYTPFSFYLLNYFEANSSGRFQNLNSTTVVIL